MKRQGAVQVEEEQRGIACVVCLMAPARPRYYTCSEPCREIGHASIYADGRTRFYTDERIAEAQTIGRAKGWRA